MDPDPDEQMPPEEEDLENWGSGVDKLNRGMQWFVKCF